VLGKIGSLFWESDHPKESAQVQKPPAAKPVQSAKPAIETQAREYHGTALGPVAYPTLPQQSRVAIPGQVDDEMAKILEDAILEANIPGFDYVEFRDVLANMSALGLPESKMFQAAFASAQIAKVTKAQLLEAIDFYLKVIDAKAKEFDDYVAGLKATDVTGKDQEIADLEAQIEADAAKIQELTSSIGERRQKQDAIRMGKAQADLDINNKTAAFEATKAVIVGKLNADRNKIDTYIQSITPT
jgi:hypothetical protein